MNQFLTRPAEPKLVGDGARPFAAVVAYDGAPGCNNAKRLYSRLVEEFSDEFDLESHWWSFEQLGESRTAENAVRAAREADIVIISTDCECLPKHAKRWIESSLAAKGAQDMALVALIGTTHAPTATDKCLKRLAQRAGVSYFADRFEVSNRRWLGRLMLSNSSPIPLRRRRPLGRHQSQSSSWRNHFRRKARCG